MSPYVLLAVHPSQIFHQNCSMQLISIIITLAMIYYFQKKSTLEFLNQITRLAISILVASVYGIIKCIQLSRINEGHNVNWYVGKFTHKYLVPYLNISFEISGQEYLETERPCVFLCNHQSSLDVISM
jgi:lysophosphatidate acyltransferase